MSVATQTEPVVVQRAEPVSQADLPETLTDAAFWQQYLAEDERLLWSDRPGTDFRLSGAGRSMGILFCIALLLLSPLLLPGSGVPEAYLIAVPVALAAMAVTLIPARMDQKNRRNRRYALTQMRALSLRDIRNERPRQLNLSDQTQALVMEDRDWGEYVVAMVNRSARDRPGQAVQFERLRQGQVDALQDALANRAGSA